METSEVEANLERLGLVLPEAPKPIAAYVPAMQSGNLLVVSGQLPLRAGELVAKGSVESDVSLEEAQGCARQCALNALAVVKAQLGGDWSRLEAIMRVGVYVRSDEGFEQQAQVANGASELLSEVLGEGGRHARAAVGVKALPLGAPVELELMARVT